MCISKLAVDWWTYWMRTFMLRHELSLDSSVIIQYLFYMLSLTVLSQHHAFPRQLRVHLWRFINTLVSDRLSPIGKRSQGQPTEVGKSQTCQIKLVKTLRRAC